MVALPAVLALPNPIKLLVMVALPAVLVLRNSNTGAVVGDGGAAGRAGVAEIQGTDTLLVMVALPAVLASRNAKY